MLVFCASRKQTQSCAELLSELLPSHPGCEAVAEAAQEARKALVVAMQDAMGGFSNAALEKLMLAGDCMYLRAIGGCACPCAVSDLGVSS